MHITTWPQRARQALGCILLATGAAQAGAAASGVGLNLGEWDYWSSDLPTIDQFKRAGGWFTQCTREQNANCPADWAWDTGEQAKLKLDASGWYDTFEVDRVAAVAMNPQSTQGDLAGAVGPVADRLLKRFDSMTIFRIPTRKLAMRSRQ